MGGNSAGHPEIIDSNGTSGILAQETQAKNKVLDQAWSATMTQGFSP